jgi:hypothetical protein
MHRVKIAPSPPPRAFAAIPIPSATSVPAVRCFPPIRVIPITEDSRGHAMGVGIVIHDQHGNSIQVGRVIAERPALGDPRGVAFSEDHRRRSEPMATSG